MIRTQEMVPDYYVEQSRDFQVLCRLIDYTTNALKFNIDSMQNLTDTPYAKDTVLPLIGDKFGIYDKQSYSNRQLLTALPSSLYYKGALKSISILLNAYLDSLDIFDYAIAYYSNNKRTARELTELLRQEIKPYTIVIILSTAPSLVDLHVLDEYIKMVLPCGMIIKYIFGIHKVIFDKFKYMENVFVFYVNDNAPSYVTNTIGQYKLEYDKTKPVINPKLVEKVTSSIDLSVIGTSYVDNNSSD